MIDAKDRADRARRLCQRLVREVSDFAPPGLGRENWPWESAAAADAEFMAELSAWEAEPSEAARLRVRDAYRGVVAVWRENTERYQRERAAR